MAGPQRLFAAQQRAPAVRIAPLLRPCGTPRTAQRRPDRIAGAAAAAAILAQGPARVAGRRLARGTRRRYGRRPARPRHARTDVRLWPARERAGDAALDRREPAPG